jgi:hypothetical protein
MAITGTIATAILPVSKPNFSHGTRSFYLDELIEEEKKDEGRKKRCETIQSQQKMEQQKINHLNTITKVTSANLAATNRYMLDEKVRDLVLQKEAAEETAVAAAQAKKDATDPKQNNTLKNALQKFVFCPNGLTVPDMKALAGAGM